MISKLSSVGFGRQTNDPEYLIKDWERSIEKDATKENLSIQDLQKKLKLKQQPNSTSHPYYVEALSNVVKKRLAGAKLSVLG